MIYEQAMRSIFREIHYYWFRSKGSTFMRSMIEKMWERLQGVIEVALIDESISNDDFEMLVNLQWRLYEVAQIYFL